MSIFYLNGWQWKPKMTKYRYSVPIETKNRINQRVIKGRRKGQ